MFLYNFQPEQALKGLLRDSVDYDPKRAIASDSTPRPDIIHGNNRGAFPASRVLDPYDKTMQMSSIPIKHKRVLGPGFLIR